MAVPGIGLPYAADTAAVFATFEGLRPSLWINLSATVLNQLHQRVHFGRCSSTCTAGTRRQIWLACPCMAVLKISLVNTLSECLALDPTHAAAFGIPQGSRRNYVSMSTNSRGMHAGICSRLAGPQSLLTNLFRIQPANTCRAPRTLLNCLSHDSSLLVYGITAAAGVLHGVG